MLAIHNRKGSFSEKWIEYCNRNKVEYKLVDCYRSDIIKQMSGCVGLMWHWSHSDFKAELFARQLTISLEHIGIQVFPNSKTAWHFDDKLGQKYLLEAISAPLIPSYLFFEKTDALAWVANASFPKIFKLRCGAGSENVKLVKNQVEAVRLIKRAFSSGFSSRRRSHMLKERLWHFKHEKNLENFFNISRGIARLFIPHQDAKRYREEVNYIYFQDFVPDNDCDIRVVVIGNKAFAIKRMVRSGDFRASGSGKISYDVEDIPTDCIAIALDISGKLQTQSLAFDFVLLNGVPLIVEISYGFTSAAYLKCPGYWDESMNFVNSPVMPENFMIENFLDNIKLSRSTQ